MYGLFKYFNFYFCGFITFLLYFLVPLQLLFVMLVLHYYVVWYCYLQLLFLVTMLQFYSVWYHHSSISKYYFFTVFGWLSTFLFCFYSNFSLFGTTIYSFIFVSTEFYQYLSFCYQFNTIMCIFNNVLLLYLVLLCVIWLLWQFCVLCQ